MSDETKYELNVYVRELNKDLTNLMECLRKQDKDNKAILYVGKHINKKVILPYEEYKKMCQRLEAIDNANPSEAMEDLKELHELAYGNEKTSWKIDDIRMSSHIKQSLLKAQEQDKVLKVIFEKGVEMALFNDSKTVEDYNRNRNWGAKELTQEEFDLLKRYFK